MVGVKCPFKICSDGSIFAQWHQSFRAVHKVIDTLSCYSGPFSMGPTVKWSTGHVLDGFCQNESKKCFDKNLMMDITVVAAGKYTKLSVWGDGVRRTVTARVTF